MKIKNSNCFGLIAAVAVLPLLSAYAQETPAPVAPAAPVVGAAPANFSPGVAEVVKLAQSSIGEDVVVAYVKNAQARYNLSANDIVALKNAGLSSPVISAMLNHDQSLRNQPAPASYEQKVYAPAPANPPSAIPNAPTVSPAPTVPPAPTVAAPSSIPMPTTPPPAPTSATIVEQAPPPAQVEVVPVAPGPDYYWVPGYWSWSGGWVWVGGRWAVRPWHGAVWVGGHWGMHGRGYIWMGGRWR
jgi:hypothetical protein